MLTSFKVRKVPRDMYQLAHYIRRPRFPELVRRFLYEQLNPEMQDSAFNIPLDQCPDFRGRIYIYNSAVATFHAPSDISGIGGLRRERIRASRKWRGGAPRYDCVFMEKDPDLPGFRGLHAARVFLFFSFKFQGVEYPCALVHWFTPVGDNPCPLTGMWIVKPDYLRNRVPAMSVVHLDWLLRGAHLIGHAGREFLPVRDFDYTDSLDAFAAFYVNKFADHHSHEIAF